MAFVLDASVVLAWLLPDERSELAERLIARVAHDRPRAPSLLMLEVGNALLLAERRTRIRGATVYDACYLELAQARSCTLATLDEGLARAARVEGVALLAPD